MVDEHKLAIFGNGAGELLAQILLSKSLAPDDRIVAPTVALVHELARSTSYSRRVRAATRALSVFSTYARALSRSITV